MYQTKTIIKGEKDGTDNQEDSRVSAGSIEVNKTRALPIEWTIDKFKMIYEGKLHPHNNRNRKTMTRRATRRAEARATSATTIALEAAERYKNRG